MRHRTLTLLATPAVLGAMTVAVPALAGVDDGPAAHSSSTQMLRRAHRQTPRARVPGARTPRPSGTTRPAWAHRPHGQNRKNWRHRQNGRHRKNGPHRAHRTSRPSRQPGAPGTARAFALVQPTSAGQTHSDRCPNLPTSPASANQSRASTASPPPLRIDSAAEVPVASPEVSYSSKEAAGTIAVNAKTHSLSRRQLRGRHLHTRRRSVKQLRLHDHRAVRAAHNGDMSTSGERRASLRGQSPRHRGASRAYPP